MLVSTIGINLLTTLIWHKWMAFVIESWPTFSPNTVTSQNHWPGIRVDWTESHGIWAKPTSRPSLCTRYIWTNSNFNNIILIFCDWYYPSISAMAQTYHDFLSGPLSSLNIRDMLLTNLHILFLLTSHHLRYPSQQSVRESVHYLIVLTAESRNPP